MKSKKTILLILIIVASMIPEARAITPQDQTVHITDTHDDMFITEVGIGIDSSLVTVKDPGMDIRAFLVFRELDINYWEPLKNATLRLHTSNTLDFDADSSITIYGMALSDLQLEGWLLPSTVLSIGYTSAHTDYNTSEFYGGQWHEINVTDIVEELIRNPNWDGDGHAGVETGDAIGFHIVGAEGDDKRYFYDYSVGNGLEAQLVIHWNHEPPPPTGYEEAEYNSTYRGFDIWVKITSNKIDMAYWDGSNEQYMEINTNSTDVEITGVTSQGNKPASYQIIRGPNNDIFYLGRVGGNQTLYHSYDQGETWDNYTLNDLYAELIGKSNIDGSLGIDSSGDLWIVWSSFSTEYEPTEYRVVSTHVEIDGHVLTFDNDVEYIPDNRTPYPGQNQRRPSLWIDGTDRKHLVWDGPYPGGAYGDEVFYTYKDDGVWMARVIISGVANRLYRYGNIVTSLNGTFKMVTWNSDISEIGCKYYKTSWEPVDISAAGDEYGAHLSYNDNEDKVLIAYQYGVHIRSRIFSFSDVSLAGVVDTGRDGSWPDLTFDINSNQALMVLDAGAEGIEGMIYDFDTELWEDNFTLRDTDPGYLHISSLATIDIGGGEDDEEWYAYDPDTDEIYGPFDDFDDVIDFIDEDPDPEDPAPPGWDETGPFTRFRTRLYILMMGFGLLFGPLFYFAMRRPSGYEFVIGLFIMLVGYAFLRAAAGI